jgi:hypothetical protein
VDNIQRQWRLRVLLRKATEREIDIIHHRAASHAQHQEIQPLLSSPTAISIAILSGFWRSVISMRFGRADCS